MDEKLTFEITNDKDYQTIEIYGNEEGLRNLIKIIERVINYKYHEHLMTPSWSGYELTDEPQGNDTTLVNKVTIIFDTE